MREYEKQPVSSAPTAPRERGLDFLDDVTLAISVRLGSAAISIRDLLGLSAGSVLELDKLPNEPLELVVNGRLVAKGEVVVVNDRYGIRLTEVVSPDDLR